MKVWLTIYKDGKPMPDGFATDFAGKAGGRNEIEIRLELALYALQSLGCEPSFTYSEPEAEIAAANGYEGLL